MTWATARLSGPLDHAGRQLWRFRRSLRQRTSAAFVDAYVAGIARRVPVLYLVILFDVMLLSASYRGVAPLPLLSVGGVLALVAGVRGRDWLPRRVAAMSIEVKRRALQRMNLVGGTFALVFMLWTVALASYGTIEQRMLVQYVLAVTAFAAILALAQAPRTAFNVALAFSIPAMGVFLAARDTAAMQLALVQLVFTITMMVAIATHHHDFVRRELARQQLSRRLTQTTREARDHLRNATMDELTGGLNRRAILALLRDEVARRGSARPWLALVDLDGFKHVNDTYGHAAGDEVLREVASRIGNAPGVVAQGRLGGDEFAIVIDRAWDTAQAMALCRALSDMVRQPIAFQGTRLSVFASIGLYRLDQDATGACLERADAALYKAKQQGDGAVVLFGEDDETALRQRAAITRQFHDSVLPDRLKLLYQPVVDVRAGRVIGAEALARWSPDGKVWQLPAMFMAMAHATGRTGEVTRVVLARALRECAPTENGLALSVNLSARDVMRDGLADQLAEIVAGIGAAPDALIFDVTERALLDDPRRATRQIEALRARGFRVALDDFGAGWSSLSQLRDLPLDLIKLNGALAEALPHDPGARAVAGMIVALAWQLGLECTIKGIETDAQADAARALGITLMQGYHFGAPDTADALLTQARRAVA